MKKFFCLTLLFTICFFSFSGCHSQVPHEDNSDITITDLSGRIVQIPKKVEKVACIGAGALRLFCYVGDLDMLCGVEACEYGFLISERPYQSLNQEVFKKLPSIGAGGPQSSPDAEALLAANPDVIFSMYTSDPSAMDQICDKTGIPVVVLSYGETEAFDTDILDSLNLIGKITGKEQRAKEVVEYIKAIENDLNQRTNHINDSDKKTVYLACHSKYGTHGIGSSTANYSLFNAVNAKNVLDIYGYKGYQNSIDTEALITMNPDVMILDAGGLHILKEEYKENKDLYKNLSPFKNGEIYLQMPYNAYYTNLEIAFSNAYFIGKSLYPAEFSDIEIGEKFDEICSFLLGKKYYNEISQTMYGGYGKLNASFFNH